MNEMLVYTITALIAVSTGMTFGAVPASPLRVITTTAGVMSTVAIVIGAVVIGPEAPWMGPLFAVTAGLSALLVAAVARSAVPGLIGEPYWRRVKLIAFHNGRLRTVEGH
ncbi:hypothetical protein [Microbacterium hominis]|uniref:Uncharacterized protein n=1 Tax=Microbacterium hominis TaxID=162426 RepID=A0A2K9DN17_9MICO|nr:hypothetical protein [Microbacterium hominis]AUG29748.1 hypothetical protein CXR34_10030 [Microbacterium hominis]